MPSFYILDTSVILFDPKSITSFKDSHVIIPETVLKELDRKKSLNSVIGKHARESIRLLKALSEKGKEESISIIQGVKCSSHSGTVRIFSEDLRDIPAGLSREEADNIILSAAITIGRQEKGSSVYLVTKDTSLELKAQVHSIATDDYSSHSKSLYSGYTGVIVDEKPHKNTIAKLYEAGVSSVPLPRKYKGLVEENGFIVMKGAGRGKQGGDVLLQLQDEKLYRCKDRYSLNAYNVSPLNHEQYFALSLLLDPDISLVTLGGPAGTGKTLLSLAAAIYQVEEFGESSYKKVMFARSLTPLGGKEQIGFLKGSLDEKLEPWTKPISDNINHIIKAPTDPSSGEKYDMFHHYVSDGILEVAALQYIRGRSLVDTYLIIDECQNITRNEIYTIISRIGDGSKVVLLGDNLQVDAPYLSPDDNALVHVIEAFKDSKIAGHVTLTESVRSELAKEAAERLML